MSEKNSRDQESLKSSIERLHSNLENLREYLFSTHSFHSEEEKKIFDKTLRPIVDVVINSIPQKNETTASDQASKEKDIKIEIKDGNLSFSGDPQKLLPLVDAMQELKKQSKRTARRIHSTPSSILFGSTILALTGTLEYFICDVMKLVYAKWPQKIDSSESIFKFSELMKFNSIQEAREYIIEQKIEAITRNKIEDAILSIQKEVSIKSSIGPDLIDELIEIHARRNIIAHNNSVINRTYQNRISSLKDREVPTIGKKIQLSKEYVLDAIDTCETVFLTLAWEISPKIDGNNEEIFNLFNSIGVEHIKNGRYRLAEILFLKIRDSKWLKESERLMANINYWQSMKWNGKMSVIEDEVKKMDTTASKEIFAFAKDILLENYTNFESTAQKLIDNEQISEESFVNWPLFKAAREREDLKDFFTKCQPEDSKNKLLDKIKEFRKKALTEPISADPIDPIDPIDQNLLTVEEEQ